MKKIYKLKIYFQIATFLYPLILFSQNEVCFEISSNPNSLNPALSSFTKYINVLDCVDIYAESQISDSKILHAAAIMAELLDNDEVKELYLGISKEGRKNFRDVLREEGKSKEIKNFSNTTNSSR